MLLQSSKLSVLPTYKNAMFRPQSSREGEVIVNRMEPVTGCESSSVRPDVFGLIV